MSKVLANKRRTLLTLSLLALGMFGLSFAMVPLYDLFCQVTGIQSISVRTNSQPQTTSQLKADEGRLVTIKFDTTIHPSLPWQFRPEQTQMKVIPGTLYKVAFIALNNSNDKVTAQAIPSVAPWQATGFLNKLECFCFNKQTLSGGQQVDMPLQFRLSPDLPADIRSLTLSYSLMRLESDKASILRSIDDSRIISFEPGSGGAQ